MVASLRQFSLGYWPKPARLAPVGGGRWPLFSGTGQSDPRDYVEFSRAKARENQP